MKIQPFIFASIILFLFNHDLIGQTDQNSIKIILSVTESSRDSLKVKVDIICLKDSLFLYTPEISNICYGLQSIELLSEKSKREYSYFPCVFRSDLDYIPMDSSNTLFLHKYDSIHINYALYANKFGRKFFKGNDRLTVRILYKGKNFHYKDQIGAEVFKDDATSNHLFLITNSQSPNMAH